MRAILDSGTSSVLLNGVLGKVFHCRRGVRQRDPLSPLLFVLAADLLQSIINKAKSQGLLKLLKPLNYTNDFPIIQYADDILLIMEACGRQLWILKVLLQSFGESTGLKVNYAKSFMVPIKTSLEKLQHLVRTFQKLVASPLLTWDCLLALPSPESLIFFPLVSKGERRLAATSIFLN